MSFLLFALFFSSLLLVYFVSLYSKCLFGRSFHRFSSVFDRIKTYHRNHPAFSYVKKAATALQETVVSHRAIIGLSERG